MTKSQIKQELRRSACEDEYPLFDINQWGFEYAASAKTTKENEFLGGLDPDEQRIFFLLVAEAM